MYCQMLKTFRGIQGPSAVNLRAVGRTIDQAKRSSKSIALSATLSLTAFLCPQIVTASETTINGIADQVSVITAISGTGTDDAGVADVKLTLIDVDSGFYWNGYSFQESEENFDADLSDSSNSISWNYSFPASLSAGQYTLSATSINSTGVIDQTPATETFLVTGYIPSTGQGSWAPKVNMPSIPVAAANLPDGRILTWAAYKKDDYKPYGSDNQQTYTSIFNPSNNQTSLELVDKTDHDMGVY